MMSYRSLSRAGIAFTALFATFTLAQVPPKPAGPPIARDLAGYRAKYPSVLTKHGGPPDSWRDATPLKLPDGVDEVTYESDGLKLKAWISRVPQDGQLHPAVVFCHGGFWFGNEDWDLAKAFVDAGFVLMMPRVRSENDNPGEFEYFYGEVDDAVASGKFLAAQKGIDTKRVFISGHSAGGTLATMAVMVDSPYALAAPIGAVLDMRSMILAKDQRHKDLIVFDPTNINQVEARSAMLFTASLRSPIVLIRGDKDGTDHGCKQFAGLATHFKKQVGYLEVPGDHGQSLVSGVPMVIQLFKEFDPAKGLK